MKLIVLGVGGLAAIVILIVLIGLTLPVHHTAGRKARFKQSPQAIFDAISGPSDWRSDVKRIEHLGAVNGRERWNEFRGPRDSIIYELVESTPPLRRVVRIADENLPFGGTWTLEIAPSSGGSVLRITERGEVKHPLFRFVSRFIIGHYRSIDTYLTDLAKKFGEPLRMEP